ncbi:hypothetical protein ACWGQ5_18440 [Streptomyces sp. NPDC055722]
MTGSSKGQATVPAGLLMVDHAQLAERHPVLYTEDIDPQRHSPFAERQDLDQGAHACPPVASSPSHRLGQHQHTEGKDLADGLLEIGHGTSRDRPHSVELAWAVGGHVPDCLLRVIAAQGKLPLFYPV